MLRKQATSMSVAAMVRPVVIAALLMILRPPQVVRVASLAAVTMLGAGGLIMGWTLFCAVAGREPRAAILGAILVAAGSLLQGVNLLLAHMAEPALVTAAVGAAIAFVMGAALCARAQSGQRHGPHHPS